MKAFLILGLLFNSLAYAEENDFLELLHLQNLLNGENRIIDEQNARREALDSACKIAQARISEHLKSLNLSFKLAAQIESPQEVKKFSIPARQAGVFFK